ncbi:pyrroline-5-carboxylate reductase [Cantharellus anzutake]|uniref:pyrroline-5-carboxylate reductase n=1 Tax=Cantharellus anzutake TaxID=1750568 RepID=UPI0019086D49|nr:pyrroline-5-carboxylate reductase [Cantharellus anzutake]KAF8328917.1 pyrroline-5-carboxylate reductase [Cantharellus anzutake]
MGYKLCLLGCGTMGIAITSGLISSLETRWNSPVQTFGDHPPSSGTSTPVPSYMMGVSEDALPSKFLATVSRKESAKKLRKLFSESFGELANLVDIFVGENVAAVRDSDVVLVCCKPQLAEAILTEEGMREAIRGKLVISIMAGVTINQLSEWLDPSVRVIRAMPNTPSKIREGMTIVSTLPSACEANEREIILAIFSSIGRCRFLDEKHFDACTALCGSGPAFVSIVLEALADGGVMMGLPRVEALELAAQTVQGTARMVLQTGIHPAALKDSVTTPGGCTIAGLLSLEDGRVRSTFARAIQVATIKAHELGQPTKH